MRWQMALYHEMADKAEGSARPEQIARGLQEVSAVLYHLQHVWGAPWGSFLSPHAEGGKSPQSSPHNSPAQSQSPCGRAGQGKLRDPHSS